MTATLIQADARHIPLADRSVQMVCTSPPYWGLRSYGIGTENGEIGLEATPDEYVATLVQVFREVWRVLRDDGCAFVNMGDSYAQATVRHRLNTIERNDGRDERWLVRDQSWIDNGRSTAIGGLKPKDLCGIPWRVAFALQADGWYLRSDCIWSKPNPMPESVTDRPTKSHEYVFMLTKRERYYYDSNAVREKSPPVTPRQFGNKDAAARLVKELTGNMREGVTWQSDGGRNMRSVWTITPTPLKYAHFATFPPALVERCVKAGTSEKGCCPHCGKCWERVTSGIREETGHGGRSHVGNRDSSRGDCGVGVMMRTVNTTLGFRQSCSCLPASPRPCVVYDPFGGAGTVPLVASNLGRHGIMTELSAKYIRMARRRITRPHAAPERALRAEHHPLFDRQEQP